MRCYAFCMKFVCASLILCTVCQKHSSNQRAKNVFCDDQSHLHGLWLCGLRKCLVLKKKLFTVTYILILCLIQTNILYHVISHSMYGASGAAPREARGRARERPDVLPAPAPLEEPAPPSLPRPGKDSVARLTLTGLSYVVTVSITFYYVLLHFINSNSLQSIGTDTVIIIQKWGWYIITTHFTFEEEI